MSPFWHAFIHGFIGALIGWLGCYAYLGWRVRQLCRCIEISSRSLTETTEKMIDILKEELYRTKQELEWHKQQLRDRDAQAGVDKEHSKEA
jgi:hypothetical protein